MWYEADLDALMKRTKDRPLPAGRMDRQSALHFGVGLGVFSVLLMGVATNWFAATILAVSILFYVLVYTVWLKRRTPQNIVIGGAAGAFPPVIGWAAATGDVTLLPLLLFTIIFLWTPPHFWALSLFVRSDYAAAGVPMLPVVSGPRVTRQQVALYTLPMAVAAIAPWPLGLAGPVYGIARACSASPSRCWRCTCSPIAPSSPRACGRKSACSLSRSSISSPSSALWWRTGGWHDPRRLRRPDPRPAEEPLDAMAVALGAFVVLMFAITIAKLTVNQ
jgi:hypothetical protein